MVRGQKEVCVPKIGIEFPAPLINFIFCLRKFFLMWVDEWVGRGWLGPLVSPFMQISPYNTSMGWAFISVRGVGHSERLRQQAK